jgi:hypothetical protein
VSQLSRVLYTLIDASSLLHLSEEGNWREKGEVRESNGRERGRWDIYENMKE